MRIVEDFLDDIAGSIEQKAASTIVSDDQEVEELLPNDESFRFQLYFDCPQLELLRNENSIKKAIDKGTEMISSLFDASRQVENYSVILPVSTHINHRNSKHFQRPVIRDTNSSAGFEVGVNFHLTNIKGVIKLVKILANIADSFTKRYDHGEVVVMKWVERAGNRKRDVRCIRAREINYFADSVFSKGGFSMNSTSSTVI